MLDTVPVLIIITSTTCTYRHRHPHTHEKHDSHEVLGLFFYADFDIKSKTLKEFRHILWASASLYSRLSLSRTRLSRITAYLEVIIWSLF